MLSGVERRRESMEERDCLALSERSKKKKVENINKEVQTQICTRKCCLSSPKIKSGGVNVKKYLLDIKSNKGFLLCKD